MTSRRLHIHSSLCDLSILSSLFQYEFYILEITNFDLSWLKFILICHYLLLFILSVEKISHSFNVNFKATHTYLNLLPLIILILLKSLKDHSDRPWHEAKSFFSHTSFHSESFSSWSLAISENANFEAIKSTSDNISDFIKDFLLSAFMIEDLIKFEFIWLVLLRLSTYCLWGDIATC